MNLILFEPAEADRPLSRTDPRALHLLEVLRRKEGDGFDAGLVNGPKGKGTVIAIGSSTLTLKFNWGATPPSLDPITLILGLPRPQTARKVLADAAALGVRTLHFVRTEKGEPNYGQSTLWSSGEWRRHLIAGAEQAFDTRLPEVTHGLRPNDAVARLAPDGTRIALDNYEAPQALSDLSVIAPVVLALGPERGWSGAERDLLRAHGFAFAHLGARVLRAETACVAATTLVKAKLGLL
jgi:RsmE family RNA methyltransferase